MVRALEITIRSRIPVTTPGRTLLDLGDVLTPRRHERAVHEAEVQRLVTIDALQAQIAGSPGRRAAARLQAIIADGPAPTRSELEDAMLALLKRHGFPRPQINARIGADEVDLWFPDATSSSSSTAGATTARAFAIGSTPTSRPGSRPPASASSARTSPR
jgi:hypothetical protein